MKKKIVTMVVLSGLSLLFYIGYFVLVYLSYKSSSKLVEIFNFKIDDKENTTLIIIGGIQLGLAILFLILGIVILFSQKKKDSKGTIIAVGIFSILAAVFCWIAIIDVFLLLILFILSLAALKNA